MTITEFLLARIAEDEAVARACGGAAWILEARYVIEVIASAKYPGHLIQSTASIQKDRKAKGGPFPIREGERAGRIVQWAGECRPCAMAHIARHDPARVLAECEAKRAIVALAEYADEAQGGGAAIALFDGYREVHPGRKAMLGVLPALASVYASHPDYDAEWSA